MHRSPPLPRGTNGRYPIFFSIPSAFLHTSVNCGMKVRATTCEASTQRQDRDYRQTENFPSIFAMGVVHAADTRAEASAG